MALPKFEDIIKLYLYGSHYVPHDLISASIIRPNNAQTSISISTTEFMNSGAGRFAVGAQFDLVKEFFTAESTELPPGTYTKAQLANLLDAPEYYGWDTQQYLWQDENDDYTERTLIYNSIAFKMVDNVEFVVTSGGSRYINNFAVVPDGGENFDLVSNDPLAILGNIYLGPQIDPSQIGKLVNIFFTGSVTTKTYTSTDFLQEMIKIANWSDMALGKLGIEANQLINDLWHDGITHRKNQPDIETVKYKTLQEIPSYV